MNLTQQLTQYCPWNEQEEADRRELLRRLESGEDLYTRSNAAAHLTASAWVVSPDRQQVLMAYHNLYDSWAWLGGHADGERDLLAVALREVREESGLTDVRPITEDIYSLEILSVDGHEKHGRYVSSHLHLNVTYLLEADPPRTSGPSSMKTAGSAGSRRRGPWLPPGNHGTGSASTKSSTKSWRPSDSFFALNPSGGTNVPPDFFTLCVQI